jgi:protein kinase A
MEWVNQTVQKLPYMNGRKGVLIGDRLYLVGGRKLKNQTGVYTTRSLHASRDGKTSVEWVLLPTTGECEPPTAEGTAVAVVGEEAYAFGGLLKTGLISDLLLFSPQKQKFERLGGAPGNVAPEWPVPTDGHSMVHIDGTLYVFGGHTKDAKYVNTMHAYTIATKKWRIISRPGAPIPRHLHTAVVVNGKMLVFGGKGSGACYNDLFMFDPKADAKEKASISVKGETLVPATAAGGGATAAKALSDVDGDKGAWTQLQVTGMKPGARWGHSCAAVGRKIFVYGGWNGTWCLGDVLMFDIDTLAWTTVPLAASTFKPSARTNHIMVVLREKGSKTTVAAAAADDDDDASNTYALQVIGGRNDTALLNELFIGDITGLINGEIDITKGGDDDDNEKADMDSATTPTSAMAKTTISDSSSAATTEKGAKAAAAATTTAAAGDGSLKPKPPASSKPATSSGGGGRDAKAAAAASGTASGSKKATEAGASGKKASSPSSPSSSSSALKVPGSSKAEKKKKRMSSRRSMKVGKKIDVTKAKLSDYELLATVGTGSFGRVRLCLHKSTNTYMAIKILKKQKIIELKQVDHMVNEKRILEDISHPFVVNCTAAFQDKHTLYLTMDYVAGGEFFTRLRSQNTFSNDTARFYAASVVLIFQYLHSKGVVYRDLKPENLLICTKGYLKLTDFGFAKVVDVRTWTLCGTPEYIAPEILLNKSHSKPVDWWALGILIYEMLAGFPPFCDNDPMVIYEKILKGTVRFPSKNFCPEVKDLIQKLLTADITKRLGNLAQGVEDIRNHAWFKSLNWSDLYNYKLPSPWIPTVKGPGDTTLFDKYPDSPPDVGPKQTIKDDPFISW